VRIVLHIERVVVDSAVMGNERPAHVRAALEGELSRLLAAPGAANALCAIGATDSIAPIPLSWPARGDACLGARVGTRIATSLGLDATSEVRGGRRV
jgi:hypothetical protein